MKEVNQLNKSQSVVDLLSTSFRTETTIRKWGNSDGIRLPKTCMDMLQLKTNEDVEISVTEDIICIRKIPEKKYKNLRERLEDFYQCPFEEIQRQHSQEVDWGTPEGEEIW